MADTELLIAIKTALEAGGLDAAKAKLEELTSSTTKSSAASAAQGLEAVNAERKLRATLATVGGLSSAMRDGSSSVEGVSRALSGLSSLLGRTGLVVGSAIAGWKAGLQLQGMLWDLLVVQPALKNTSALVLQTREEFDKLNQAKLDSLSKETTRLQAEVSKILSDIEAATQRANALRSAEGSAKIADIMATMPEGPDRDRAVAAERRRIAVTNAQSEAGLQTDTIANKQDVLSAERRKSMLLSSDIAAGEDRFKQWQTEAATRAAQGMSPELLQQERDRHESQLSILNAEKTKSDERIALLEKEIADAQNRRAIAQANIQEANSSYTGEVKRIDAKVSAEEQASQIMGMRSAAESERDRAKADLGTDSEKLKGLQERLKDYQGSDNVTGMQTVIGMIEKLLEHVAADKDRIAQIEGRIANLRTN